MANGERETNSVARFSLTPAASKAALLSWWGTSETRKRAVCRYFDKWGGEIGAKPGPIPNGATLATILVGTFAVMSFMSGIAYSSKEDLYLAPLGSFGAAAILLFGAPAAPFSQPRNMIGGQIVATVVGVAMRIWIADPMGSPVLALPVALTISMFFMQLTRTTNPPAGGTCAIAVISSPALKELGFGLILSVMLWSTGFVLIGCIVINFHPKLKYPLYWIRPRKGGADASTLHMPVSSNLNKRSSQSPSVAEDSEPVFGGDAAPTAAQFVEEVVRRESMVREQSQHGPDEENPAAAGPLAAA